jgi:NAD(P)-dependent dehydrogenase (short-subunit alcohol dehydrogenase family)
MSESFHLRHFFWVTEINWYCIFRITFYNQPMLPAQTPGNLPGYPLALVTGAAHRLGRAFAISLARQGYAIVLHYHSATEKLAVALDEIRAEGVPVFPIQADLRDESEIHALFTGIDALLERPESGLTSLRMLVNSAAVMGRAEAQNMSSADFDEAINLNLRAPFLCAQMAYARMPAGSLIVNISDVAAQKVWTGFPAYVISKAGLDSLTKILARSFAPKVRVNAIAPGLVLASDDTPPAEWSRLVRRIPAQRAASLDELGMALEFLQKNEYITGQVIVVDGGYSLI